MKTKERQADIQCGLLVLFSDLIQLLKIYAILFRITSVFNQLSWFVEMTREHSFRRLHRIAFMTACVEIPPGIICFQNLSMFLRNEKYDIFISWIEMECKGYFVINMQKNIIGISTIHPACKDMVEKFFIRSVKYQIQYCAFHTVRKDLTEFIRKCIMITYRGKGNDTLTD